MPKEKESLSLIPNLYRKKYEDLGLFFWVEAQKDILPNITTIQSIKKYIKFVGIELDEQVAVTTYNRIKKEFLHHG